MVKLIKIVVFGWIFATAAFAMIGDWGVISKVQGNRVAADTAQASETLCKDYNEKNFVGKMFDISARGWCD